MGFLLALIKDFAKKILSLIIIGALIFWAWNNYRATREARTFVVSFSDVEGLTKGAPIYANGLRVGKIIQIFPLANSNNVGVKGLLTNKDFPCPSSFAFKAKIINNIERGGGKVLEISYLGLEGKRDSRGHNPYILKHALKIIRDFLQLTKDFCNDIYNILSSKKAEENKDKLENTIRNTITSIEYGTIKQDVSSNIEHLNKEIKEMEKNPNKKKKVQNKIEDSAKALSNTIKTFGSLSDAYK